MFKSILNHLIEGCSIEQAIGWLILRCDRQHNKNAARYQQPSARRWLLIACGIFIVLPIAAQDQPTDSLLNRATLDQVVQYALKHQPALQQAQLDKKII